MKRMISVMLLAVLLVSVFAVTAEAKKYTVKYIVTTGNCNIRSKPNLKGEVLGSASKGTEYGYDTTKKDKRGVLWYGIIYGSYGTAWISSANAKKVDPHPTTKVKYIKTTGSCNVRHEPNLSSEQIGSASKGQVFGYDRTKKDSRGVLWYGVIYGSYGTGWISSKNTVRCKKNGKVIDPDPTPAPTPKPTPKPIDYSKFKAVEGTYMVMGDGVNMRAQPSTDYSILGVYHRGDLLEGVKSDGKWMELKDMETGRVGYLSCQYLEEYEEPEPEPIEEANPLNIRDSELVSVNSAVVDTFEELQLAVPSAALVDVPEGSTEVQYGWIEVEGILNPIAQISFQYQGVDFILRASPCETLEETADIDGVTLDIDHDEATEEPFHLDISEDGQTAVIHHYDAEALTQYSLSGPAIGNGIEVEKLAKALFAEEAEEAEAA